MTHPNETKLTSYIDTDLYYRVTGNLHWGQLTHLLRNFMLGIDQLQQTDSGKDDVILFLNGRKPLTIPQTKEE